MGDQHKITSDEETGLYLVFGGELKDLKNNIFRHAEDLDIVGTFSVYDKALNAWRAKAQQTVDNAHMCYYIINLQTCLNENTINS